MCIRRDFGSASAGSETEFKDGDCSRIEATSSDCDVRRADVDDNNIFVSRGATEALVVVGAVVWVVPDDGSLFGITVGLDLR